MKLIFFVAISLLLSYFGADANAFGVDAELEKASKTKSQMEPFS